MKFLTKAILPVIVCFVVMGSNLVIAANNNDSPKEFVKILADKMITNVVNAGSSSKEKENTFREIFVEYLDIKSISKFVLGPNWRRLDDNKRNEFIKVFTDVSVITWSRRFDDYKGLKINFSSSKPATGKDQFFVDSSIEMGDSPITVVWRIKAEKKSYKIIDIIVENVSMAMTYRSEYNAIIQNSADGIDGLIKALKDKIAEFNNN